MATYPKFLIIHMSFHESKYTRYACIHSVYIMCELFFSKSFMSSLQVVSAAVAHSINVYHVPAVNIEGRVCITNTPSNIAFRGYGRPQGMIMIEDMMDRAAHQLDIDPALVWPAITAYTHVQYLGTSNFLYCYLA